ncbi:MAG: hypothetical protein KGL69_01880 [Alphaproteobacteria bacterium]|nr:hypothetical protein [Alphaproteobacteria bacterium]
MQITALRLARDEALVIVDVDEVLALFVEGFSSFAHAQGYELRLERFALFQNLYRRGEAVAAPLSEGRALFDAFFALETHDLRVAPGAVQALEGLAQCARVVILTNAPAVSRPARTRWLADRGLPYDLVIGSGPKGPAVAAMAAGCERPVAFVDDLLANLDSVAEAAPHVHRFQSVADVRLRPMAPTAPERHARFDDWTLLGPAIAARLGV